MEALQDLWNSEVTWWGGLIVLAVVIPLGLMAAGLVIGAHEMAKMAGARVQAWWATARGELHVHTPVVIALIVSTTVVLCVWIVMYLSPYPTCVRHALMSDYEPDAAGLYCARELNGG